MQTIDQIQSAYLDNHDTSNSPAAQNLSLFDLPIDPQVMFSNHKDVYKKGVEKRQRKLVEKISFIQPFLADDETILLVTTGRSPISVGEQLIMGWIVFYLKRAIFIFTNKRIFHVPTKPDHTYRHSIAQISYADCQSLAVKGRQFVANYKNGKSEKFQLVGTEKKKISALLQKISLEGQPTDTQHRTHLCPRCTSRLISEQYTCPNCRLQFKSRAEARKISIIYPGGGYFYTRHPFLGLSDAVVEVLLLSWFTIALINAVAGIGGSLEAAVVYGLVLAFEKLITVYDSNKFIAEYIPAQKNIEPIRPQQNPVSESARVSSWRGT